MSPLWGWLKRLWGPAQKNPVGLWLWLWLWLSVQKVVEDAESG